MPTLGMMYSFRGLSPTVKNNRIDVIRNIEDMVAPQSRDLKLARVIGRLESFLELLGQKNRHHYGVNAGLRFSALGW